MSNPRKLRRDAALSGLSPEQRARIASWLEEDGWQSCCQRIKAEMGIEIGKTALYRSLARWATEEQFDAFQFLAIGQAEAEADRVGGMSVAEMEEAIDRHFLTLAAQKRDPELYKDVRYMQIAQRSAKANAEIAQAKLQQGERKLRQKDQDLAMAERKLAMLEAKEKAGKETLQSTELSEAEQIAKMKEIFGVS